MAASISSVSIISSMAAWRRNGRKSRVARMARLRRGTRTALRARAIAHRAHGMAWRIVRNNRKNARKQIIAASRGMRASS